MLAHNPFRVGKALRDDLAGRYSARRGDFRVIYEIHDDRVVVRSVDGASPARRLSVTRCGGVRFNV